VGAARNPEDPKRAQLARELNMSIHEVAASLSGEGDEDFEMTFYCECGCLSPLRLTLSGFEAGGALIAGHSRPEMS